MLSIGGRHLRNSATTSGPRPVRRRIEILGAVQGVGFRPLVYRLATGSGVSGWVRNGPGGVVIEAQGSEPCVTQFEQRLRREPPPHAWISSFTSSPIAACEGEGFRVVPSAETGRPAAFLLPDLAICSACRREILDPSCRRFRYAFTTCTDCGPRYSIVDSLPYDRVRTAMAAFPMCPVCEAEYRDPANRRFHAQTNCCPACGPRLTLLDPRGGECATDENALAAAGDAIRLGRIVAVKGAGGFHLVCDARNPAAVALLRQRKHRPAKPFALMLQSLDAVREICAVPPAAASLLESAQAPIVLLDGHRHGGMAAGVAPDNPTLGVMLPYTPLHVLLLHDLAFPIVATSGNLADEPICTDNQEALERLRGIADLFLVHDRPIRRPIDDSVVRFIDGRPCLLRRARGYAPLPFELPYELPEMVATGAHMKNTVAFARGRLLFLSQHLGDLEAEPAYEAHRRALADFVRIYEVEPAAVVCDRHPDYGSTKSAREWAAARQLPVRSVQHHQAHVLSAIVEHHIEPPLLGVSWDGSGAGPDGTIWGGEFLVFDGSRFERVLHLLPFRLPGGEQAVKEPRRSLLGLLGAMDRRDECRHLFSPAAWRALNTMLERGVNCPWTTSAGRLFDGFAALCGLPSRTSFEGEAAMALEFVARGGSSGISCALPRAGDVLDWRPLLDWVLARRPDVAVAARSFHLSLAAAIVECARFVGVPRVALTGGCFQNALLSELAAEALRAAGFHVYLHQALPPNDGGIAAGQLAGALLDASVDRGEK